MTDNFLHGIWLKTILIFAAISGNTHAQSVWTAQTSGTTGTLYSIAHGSQQLVAVGSNATILNSTNGVNWIPRTTSQTTNTLNSVASGVNFFIAVGDVGTILTSSDGISWISRNSGTTNSLKSISQTGSILTAVGTGGTIITSADNGQTWVSRPSGTTNILLSVTWTGGQLVAVGSGGVILTSPNGTIWTSRNSGTMNNLFSVVWKGSSTASGIGQIVAVGTGGVILTSSDGISWTSQTSGTTKELSSITWTSGQLVAVGSEGIILTSPDCINWTSRTSGTTGYLFSVVYTGSQLITVGGTAILTSFQDPTAVKGTVLGNGSVLVQWIGASSISPITGYSVTSKPEGRMCTSTGSGATCVIDNLTDGLEYSFTVTAMTSSGSAGTSAPSSTVIPIDPPSAPSDVISTGGNAQANITWSAPTSNGGSIITAYKALAIQDTSKHCTTTGELTCTVNGLDNGLTYTFTVTATNAAGTGPMSIASPPVSALYLKSSNASFLTLSSNEVEIPENNHGAIISIMDSNGRTLWFKEIEAGVRHLTLDRSSTRSKIPEAFVIHLIMQ